MAVKTQLWSMLLQASERIEAQLEAALAESGLSLSKLGVLNHLVQAGEPLPLSRLAERSSCVKSNMTQLVDKLEHEGLVERVADPEDRRSVRAVITEEGRRRHELGSRALVEQEKTLAGGFNADEREQFLNFLRRVSRT